MKTTAKLLLLLFIVFNMKLIAGLKLNSSDSFVKAEPFIFEFEVSGSSIKFPKIEKIGNYVVQTLGTSRSLQIVNGSYSEKISQKYQIVPQNEFTIPSFTFEIDGKKVESKEKKIIERTINKTLSNNFDLSLKASKMQAYLGEDILVKMIFKYKKNLQITNLGFEQPHFENFWYKKLDTKTRSYEEGDYIVQELDFLLFPQKSGKLIINPLSVIVQLVSQNSNFGNFSFLNVPKEKRVYSNKLEFDIKKLPKNISLIGDFAIKAEVDKTKIKEGEAVSLNLEIKGFGNFDDIDDYNLEIPNTTVYDNKAKVDTKYNNERLEGIYEKTFSLVPSETATIPSFKISYFSKKQNKVIEKSTNEIKIEVIKKIKENKPLLQKAKKETKDIKVIENGTSLIEKITYFLLGGLVTILIIGLYMYVKIPRLKSKKDNNPLLKRVKSSKSKEELLKILLPYLKYNDTLDELIFECEKTKDFKTTKKRVVSLVKELEIKG